MKIIRIISVLFGLHLLGCFPTSLSGAVPAVATEENLRAAILLRQTYPVTDLTAMDLNQDSQLDVADLLRLGRSYTTILEGFHWVVSARFDVDDGNLMPFGYSFVLDITVDHAGVGSLDEYDPTRNLLDQVVSEAGGIPGYWRDNYAPGKSIPPATTFSRSNTGTQIRLESATMIIPANSVQNPTGRALQRTWTLIIDRSALDNPTLAHGTIRVETTGFVPGSTITEGRIYLVRAGLLNPPPISVP